MLYALVDKIKITAAPTLLGKCAYCEARMIPKCGLIKTWHWAHTRAAICDDWFQPETEWHRNWKSIFGKENCEVIIHKNGQKHIADVKTKKGVVLEFQNSKISYETIEIREEFYGEMVWIINGKKFGANFSTFDLEAQIYDEFTPEFEGYAKLHGFTPNYKPTSLPDQMLRFKWHRPRECWQAAERKVYIDLGGPMLFFITEGIGENQGRGYEFSKLEFILSHNGNETLLHKLL